MDKESGVDAKELAEELNISRSNVSFFLNRLVGEGRIEKISKRRPVKYRTAAHNRQDLKSGLDIFIEVNPSMKNAVIQAKSAVLYPPHGMHMLLIGETGVGKSMFAEMIYHYAVEASVLHGNAPFIVFNCADYANNPQLLMGNLFGTKKGAYTGAEGDNPGLIERARGGILFLDEVHRLPPEGQEMFFTFMDRGIYRRMGETDIERRANVLILAATSEKAENALLQTFIRRIPMLIQIPALRERSFEERLNLICHFFCAESNRLNRRIKVSLNTMRAFLSYDCPNNIGQLRTDIQLVCARAYIDFISQKSEDITIFSRNLPEPVRSGLYRETEHRKIWNKLIDISKRFYVFDTDTGNEIYRNIKSQNETSIYEIIDTKLYEVNARGYTSESIQKELSEEIESYFASYYEKSPNLDIVALKNIVDESVYKLTLDILSFAAQKLQRSFNEKIRCGLCLHLNNTYERVRSGKKIVHPNLEKVKNEYSVEFQTACQCLLLLEKTFDAEVPTDEAGFIAMFFIYKEEAHSLKNKVAVIVIAHGDNTATSLANAANKLLGTSYAVGINALLDENPYQVLQRLKRFLIREKVSEALFLVDMGSLTSFGEEIESLLNVKVMTIPLVSTLHVVEATRKAMMGYPLQDVFSATNHVNDIIRQTPNDDDKVNTALRENKLAIVTLCTTGEGGAKIIKDILEKRLILDEHIIEIIPIQFFSKKDVLDRLQNIEKERRIIFILTTFNIQTSIPQFNFNYAFNDDDIATLQKIVDVEQTYVKMANTLKGQFLNVKDDKLLLNIKQFIHNLEIKMNCRIKTDYLVGVALHLCCLIDQLVGNKHIESGGDEAFPKKENPLLFNIISNEVRTLGKLYGVTIPDQEIFYIMKYFDEP